MFAYFVAVCTVDHVHTRVHTNAEFAQDTAYFVRGSAHVHICHQNKHGARWQQNRSHATTTTTTTTATTTTTTTTTTTVAEVVFNIFI